MELLVAALVEFIIVLAIPFVAFVFDIVAVLVALIAYLLFGHTPQRPSGSTKQAAGRPPAAPALSKGLLIATTVLGGLFLLGLSAAIVANLFFLSPTVSWIAERISQKRNIEITFSHVEGNLLAGDLGFEELRVERRTVGKTEYALTADTVRLDVDVLSLVFGETTLPRLSIEGVRGDIWASTPRPVPAAGSKAGELKPKRKFTIESLQISNARIDLHKAGTPSVSLSIDELTSALFRSQYAVFDVFFRSNIKGKIDEHDILITSSGSGAGRITKLRLTDFPAEFARHYADRIPFNWFKSGTIDILVDDTWNRTSSTEVDMDWRLHLKGVKVVAPDDSSLLARAIAIPVANYINTRDEDVELHFRLVMDQEQFETKSSLDAAGLWEAVLEGTARAIAEKTDADVDQAKTGLRNSIDELKNWLNRKRNNRSAE